MNKKAALALMMGVAMSALPREQPVKISSHKVEQKRPEEQPSKRKLQRMKGKKIRKNRGKKRGRRND